MRHFNPDCSVERRCGHCDKDRLAAKQKRNHLLGLDKVMRHCPACGLDKPLAHFRMTTGVRPWYRKRCHECSGSPPPRAARVDRQPTRSTPRPKPQPVPESYLCVGQCGRAVRRRDMRCAECRRNQRARIAHSGEHQIKQRRITDALERGSILGVMYLDGEPYTLSSCCNICRRPVVHVASLCYTCATGRPIELAFRPTVVLPEQQHESA